MWNLDVYEANEPGDEDEDLDGEDDDEGEEE